MLTKNKKELLEKLYYKPETGFTSAKKLWLQAHKENPKINQSDVNRYLSTQPAYARHRQVPRPKTSIWNQWIDVSYPGQLVAVDIWFLGKQTKSQFPHALVAVDALSKLAAVVPVRNLTAKNVANAMEKIIKNYKFKIHSAFSDHGVEFMGKPFRDTMKQYNIKQIFYIWQQPFKNWFGRIFDTVVANCAWPNCNGRRIRMEWCKASMHHLQ